MPAVAKPLARSTATRSPPPWLSEFMIIRTPPRSASELPTGILGREHLLDAARGLSKALLILHQSNAHEALAVLAKTHSGRDGDIAFRQQPLGEFDRAEVVKPLGDRGPGEHARLRNGNFPAGAAEAFDQHVAAFLVQRAVLLDDVLRAVERCDGGCLDRREGAVIEVRLHPRQR